MREILRLHFSRSPLVLYSTEVSIQPPHIPSLATILLVVFSPHPQKCSPKASLNVASISRDLSEEEFR